jgi:phage/plasmid-like protein (TIGR03299 family)
MAFTADSKAWWDGMGTYVREAQTWESVLETAALDWTVEKTPIFTQSNSGLVKVDSHVAIRRADTLTQLGIVGAAYQPIQNHDCLKWTEALLETGAVYESAGGLGNGERIWLLARMPMADFTVGKNDEHRVYVLVTTSHDGSMSMTCKMTDTRVVCQNTLAVALADGKQQLRVKHTRSAEDRLRMAQRIMTASIQTAETLKAKFDRLAKATVSKEQLELVMAKLFPINVDEASKATITRRENVMTEILELYADNDGNMFPEQRGTAYALLNAVTNFTDHARATRVKTGNPQTNMQARTESAIWGSGAQLKDSALATIEAVCTGDTESDAMWSELFDAHGNDQA